MADPRRWTIDALARDARTTTRSIRAHQARGLLPPPTLDGRTGYYGPGHLARLRMIGRLQDRGFSLEAIRQSIRAWEEGRSLHDLLGFEETLTTRVSEEEPRRLTKRQVDALFPGLAKRPELLAKMAAANLLHPDGTGFRTPSPRLLEICAEYVAAGLPLDRAADTFVQLSTLTRGMVDLAVELFLEHVWGPFERAGRPPRMLADITARIDGIRPLLPLATALAVAREVDRVVDEMSERLLGAAHVSKVEPDR